MITVPISANINSVDAPSGATLNTINVDLRQQARSGGLIEADVTATQVSAGSAALPAYVTVDQKAGTGTDAALFVDLRQQSNEGGFFEAELQASAIAYAGGAPPAAPTLGTASSGTQASRTEYFKTTYVDANGNESLASAEASETVGLNLVATVTSPGASTGALKYNVYGSTATGVETLQNASPINLGTNWQEPAGGLTSTGRAVPTVSSLQTGACTVTVAAGPPLAAGAATLTLTQTL